MAEMTIEQRRALALAQARLRLQAQKQAQQPAVQAPEMQQAASNPMPSVFRGGMNPRTGLPDQRDTGRMAGAVSSLQSAALEGGGAAAGQMAGAMTGVAAPVAVPVLGAIGGAAGDVAAQRLEMASNPKQGYSLGRTLGAGLSGAIPGASLAKAGVKTVAKEAAKQAAGNVAATVLESAVDEGKAPSMSRALVAAGAGAAGTGMGRVMDKGARNAAIAIQKADRAILDETIKLGRDAGYVFPPAKINENVPNTILQAMGGDTIGARASRENQKITNRLAKQYAGIPEGASLSPASIEAAIRRESKPYEEVAKLSNQAKLSLEEMKQFRAEAKKAWRAYDASKNPTPEMKDKAEYLGSLADIAEADIAQEAARLGKPQLVKQLDNARVNLAKIHMLDEAVAEGTGFVNAKSFSRALEYGRNLTDEAVTIARVAQAFPESTRPWSGVSGTSQGRIPGSQQLQLSGPYQSIAARSGYPAQRPDVPAGFAQYASRAAGREKAREQKDDSALKAFLKLIIRPGPISGFP